MTRPSTADIVSHVVRARYWTFLGCARGMFQRAGCRFESRRSELGRKGIDTTCENHETKTNHRQRTEIGYLPAFKVLYHVQPVICDVEEAAATMSVRAANYHPHRWLDGEHRIIDKSPIVCRPAGLRVCSSITRAQAQSGKATIAV